MKTPIGIDKETGKVRFIDDIPKTEKGLACNCRCPNEQCGADLVAKFCKDKVNHFAHYKNKGGCFCQEKAVHLLAKHVLASFEKATFPELVLSSRERLSYLNEPFHESETFFSNREAITDAEQEVCLPEIGIKPDVLCNANIKGYETRVAIEVKVTHAVDEEKLIKIRSARLTSFEIDLSDLVECADLTVEKVKIVLSDQSRYKWLYVEEVKNHLVKSVEKRCIRRLESRNKEIDVWQHAVVSALQKKGFVTLPKYHYEASEINPYFVDITDKRQRVSIRPPPSVGGDVKLVSVGPVHGGRMILEVMVKNKVFPLPIALNSEISCKDISPYYLHASCESELPEPDRFENKLRWGCSVTAEKYIRSLEKLKDKEREKIDIAIEKRLRVKYDEVEALLSGEKSYPVRNLESIFCEVNIADNEFSSKGIDVSPYFGDLPGGWIFGCPQKSWQVLLLRAIFIVDWDIVTIKDYAKYLKENYDLEAVEPFKSLGFERATLERLDMSISDFPNTYKVLSDYFKWLEARGFLKYIGRGSYKKLMPFGAVYEAL